MVPLAHRVLLLAGLAAATVTAAEPHAQSITQAIDDAINESQRAAGVAAAPRTSDDNLVRRLTLDLAGRIPAHVEVAEFLQADSAVRRELLVDRLLDSPRFDDYMARRFDWFISQDDGRIDQYLRKAFAERRGWDQMFRDIILADIGRESDALPYLKARVKDTERLTNEVSVAFFGVNISCAKCHDHPLVPRWKQDHFYGMKSFFDRMFDNGGFVAERDYGDVKFTTTAGDERQATLMFLSGRQLSPAVDIADDEERKRLRNLYRELKNKKQPPPPPQSSLRQQLVEVALSEGDNGFFAKSIVNRVWHQLIGYGLVMPLDQMHDENPPSHPELLDRLAADFVAHGYDLRRLMRAIVLSETYGRSSDWRGTRPDPQLFAVGQTRPLTPTQLASSLSLAAADPSIFEQLCCEERFERIDQAADPRHADRFSQPDDGFQISATEALFFSNDPEVQEIYLNGGLVQYLGQLDDVPRIVETAVQTILSRAPNCAEVELLGGYLEARSDRPQDAIQQLVWALLTSSEFRFNH